MWKALESSSRVRLALQSYVLIQFTHLAVFSHSFRAVLLQKMSKTLKKVFNTSSKLETTQENNIEENKKKWVPPVHPIPSSLFTLTKVHII